MNICINYWEGQPYTDEWGEKRLREGNKDIQQYNFPIDTDKFYYFAENHGFHQDEPDECLLTMITQVNCSKKNRAAE